MNSTPLFSIIIPTYNRANLLKKAIQSVLGQTFGNWELIIVDDGSGDDTATLAQGWPDKRIRYFSQEHRERSAARNLGIARASGRYICFLDDDDYLLPHHLQAFHDAFSRDGFPIKIYRNGFLFEAGGRRWKGPFYREKRHKNPVHFAAFNFCSACSLCLPKTCLEKDAFPEAFPYWEDTHLILRLLAQYPFQQNGEFSYVYRLHPGRNSQLDYGDPATLKKADLNVEAMRHFFSCHSRQLRQLLPRRAEAFLIAEKYLEYAGNALEQRAWKPAGRFLARSVRTSRLRFLHLPYVKFLLRLLLAVCGVQASGATGKDFRGQPGKAQQ